MEIEQISFVVSGIVKMVDGREISFKFELLMICVYYEESDISIWLGDVVCKIDLLVFNFFGMVV